MPALIQRHEKIMTLLRYKRFMSIDELAVELDVTPQTVRRDINQLCQKKMVRRYHGGAAWEDEVEQAAMRDSKHFMQLEKNKIAEKIAANIPDYASLFMSIGSTIEAVAYALVKKHKGLRVITNNIYVAAIMSKRSEHTVMITSGVVRPVDGGITGIATVDFINQFKVDYAILSAAGVDQDGTLLDFDYKEVSVMQAMMNNARLRYLAVEHTKFGHNALVRMANIIDFNAVFTDAKPNNDMVKLMHGAGVECYVAADGEQK